LGTKVAFGVLLLRVEHELRRRGWCWLGRQEANDISLHMHTKEKEGAAEGGGEKKRSDVTRVRQGTNPCPERARKGPCHRHGETKREERKKRRGKKKKRKKGRPLLHYYCLVNSKLMSILLENIIIHPVPRLNRMSRKKSKKRHTPGMKDVC
jgi:hypothetical protein